MFNSIYYFAFHPHPYGIISIFSISRFLLYHPPCFLRLVDCCIKIPLRQFPLLRCRYLCYRRPRGRRYATSAWSTRPRGRRPRGRHPRGWRPRGRRPRSARPTERCFRKYVGALARWRVWLPYRYGRCAAGARAADVMDVIAIVRMRSFVVVACCVTASNRRGKKNIDVSHLVLPIVFWNWIK